MSGTNKEQAFIGQVTMFTGDKLPTGWAFCNGAPLSVQANEALFSVIGTIYGGDGRYFFNLPDLRGRIPVGVGQAPGLGPVNPGERLGKETNTLSLPNIPSHNHGVEARLGFKKLEATSSNPENNVFAIADTELYQAEGSTPGDTLAANTIGGVTPDTGSGTPFNTYQPYLTVHYIICVQGLHPTQT